MTPVEFAIPVVESVTLLVVRASLLVVRTPLWVESVTMLVVPARLLIAGALLLVVCAPLSGLCTVSADSVRKAIEARELPSQTVRLLVGLEDGSSAANKGQTNYSVLTAHDSPQMLDEIIHNFEGVHTNGPNLIQSEPV